MTTNTARIARFAGTGLLSAGLLLGSVASTAQAKEIGSGGTGGTTGTVCNPVNSLSYKGDFRAGETGLSSIMVTYDVRPCDKTRPVLVDTSLYLTADPASVAYDDPNAPLSGKFTVFGVLGNTSYIAKVTVTDAATGAVLGSKQIYAAAVSKGV